MPDFLIDANLPKRLRFWRDDACIFLPNDEWHDSIVWRYARENNLIIVTKDGDFEKLALASGPPVVILVCVGSASRQEMWSILQQWWPIARDASQQPGCRLVRIFPDCVEVV
jgi:predicted nuclease of predicted toxin-antitoxin system